MELDKLIELDRYKYYLELREKVYAFHVKNK